MDPIVNRGLMPLSRGGGVNCLLNDLAVHGPFRVTTSRSAQQSGPVMDPIVNRGLMPQRRGGGGGGKLLVE